MDNLAERAERGTGHHLLGPHVVGRRVVIRSIVPGETGPSGGPATTDVLGVCESWGSVVSVRREDGTLVSVRRRDIVSGKPVPPRPSVRHRVSPREAEAHALLLWPDLEVEPLGEWVLRSAPAPATTGRLLKRANSCLAMGEPPPGAVEAVRRFYSSRGRPPLAQVVPGSAEADAFLAAGWVPLGYGDSLFQLASVARARRSLPAGLDLDRVAVSVRSGSGGSPSSPTRLDLRIEGIGELSALVSGDWLGLHGLAVDASYRRAGWGTTLVAAALEAGAERGCTTAWLHVETDNAAALALYGRLGFRTHHECRYLTTDP